MGALRSESFTWLFLVIQAQLGISFYKMPILGAFVWPGPKSKRRTSIHSISQVKTFQIQTTVSHLLPLMLSLNISDLIFPLIPSGLDWSYLTVVYCPWFQPLVYYPLTIFPQYCVVTCIVFFNNPFSGYYSFDWWSISVLLCYTETSFSAPQSAILIHTVSFLVEGRCEPPVTNAGNRSWGL